MLVRGGGRICLKNGPSGAPKAEQGETFPVKVGCCQLGADLVECGPFWTLNIGLRIVDLGPLKSATKGGFEKN